MASERMGSLSWALRVKRVNKQTGKEGKVGGREEVLELSWPGTMVWFGPMMQFK